MSGYHNRTTWNPYNLVQTPPPILKIGKTYISVVSAGKWLGICVNFLFRQSAIPSEHLQGVGQVHDAEGKHSAEVSISSSLPKTHNTKKSHKIFCCTVMNFKLKMCNSFLNFAFSTTYKIYFMIHISVISSREGEAR